jgi:hypothetical protein
MSTLERLKAVEGLGIATQIEILVSVNVLITKLVTSLLPPNTMNLPPDTKYLIKVVMSVIY